MPAYDREMLIEKLDGKTEVGGGRISLSFFVDRRMRSDRDIRSDRACALKRNNRPAKTYLVRFRLLIKAESIGMQKNRL
ncbi:hypothetical protein X546_21870 [Brevibacillus borstelensis cifa_chp40]|nr:hypothetical protein X546_21870 [Brevibacillus borstelensis cifa_chp40]